MSQAIDGQDHRAALLKSAQVPAGGTTAPLIEKETKCKNDNSVTAVSKSLPSAWAAWA